MKRPDPSTVSRRDALRWMGAAGGAALLGRSSLAGAAGSTPSTAAGAATRPGNGSLGPVKQIDAGVLNAGYAEVGPADGRPVVLLHGWPYDVQSFVDVAPLLAAEGHRVIVPFVRGYGTTRFRSSGAFRNSEPAAVAQDVIDLLDALRNEKAIIGGFDWGARSGDIVAALWPAPCKALVSVSGYLIGDQKAGKLPLPPAAELQWWEAPRDFAQAVLDVARR